MSSPSGVATVASLPTLPEFLGAWMTPPPGYEATHLRGLWARSTCGTCYGCGEYVVRTEDDDPFPQPCDCLWAPEPPRDPAASLPMPPPTVRPGSVPRVELLALDRTGATSATSGSPPVVRVLLRARWSLSQRSRRREEYVVIEAGNEASRWHCARAPLSCEDIHTWMSRPLPAETLVASEVIAWLDDLLPHAHPSRARTGSGDTQAPAAPASPR